MLHRRTATGDHRSPNDRARRDGGATFIELLVSIVLLGTAGVAVLVATAAAITGARTSDELSKSQSLVAEVVDYLTNTDPEHVPYRNCVSFSPEVEYQSALDARFGGGVVEVVQVRYWDTSDASVTATGDFGAVCRFGEGFRLQQVEIRSLINDLDRSVLVVKRPAAIPTADVIAAPPVPPYAAGSGQAAVSLTPGINGP